MNLKEALLKNCEVFIDNRLVTIQNTINEIQKSLLSETKSSVGDKHETGRAMLQLEREKAGQQLADIQKTKGVLFKIDSNKTSEVICLGSLIYTSKDVYYLAISAGEIKLGKELVYAISTATPIGKLLLSKKAEETVEFRGEKIIIEKVL